MQRARLSVQRLSDFDASDVEHVGDQQSTVQCL